MKSFYLTVTTFLVTVVSLCAQDRDLFHLYGTKLVNDSLYVIATAAPVGAEQSSLLSQFHSLLQKKEAGKMSLYRTKKDNTVELYFFPGKSEQRALVMGGLHGSELSSIEVAKKLVENLTAGEEPYYSVVVIPSLFPDNAQSALDDKGERLRNNTGRYTNDTTADPNRQMPLPGKAFSPEYPYDALNREIEEENRTFLELIQYYRPDRFLAIHAIKDRSKAGVFADPRTDCFGNALGFETDNALAVLMAQYIQGAGGACPGNNLADAPTAVYYLDPPVAQAGFKQVRNYEVSTMKGRGKGISMGTWCSTAICDDTERSRPAIRTFTMEFPGNLLPAEYKTAEDQQRVKKMISAYAASVQQYFLQSFFVEENPAASGARFASN